MTRLVILDTTCLYTFCRHSKHNRLQDYLGSVARITLEVRDEVAKKAGEVPRLADLLDEPVWPEWVELNPS